MLRHPVPKHALSGTLDNLGAAEHSGFVIRPRSTPLGRNFFGQIMFWARIVFWANICWANYVLGKLMSFFERSELF